MKDIVKSLKEKLDTQQVKSKKYMDYYKGKHEFNTKSWDTRNNHKEVHNFCKLFIDDNTGFLLGKPPQLKYSGGEVEDRTLVDIYNDTFDVRIQQLDQKLLRDIQIFGYAFEIDYVNKDGEFDVAIKTPMEVSVLRDGNKVVFGLLRVGSEYEDGQLKYEKFKLFDVRGKTIRDVKISVSSEDDIIFEGKPITNIIHNPIIVVYNNWERQSEMSDIMSLNDSYNRVSSDATNEISDFREAYLHFSGATLDKELLRGMQESGIIATKDKGAKVQFVTKDMNSDYVKMKLEQLKDSIYDVSGQVDFNDSQLGSNTSSLALRNKLTKLMNKLSLKENFLVEAMMLRLKNLAGYVKGSNVKVADELLEYKNVDINFIFNIPTNDKEVTEMIVELYGAGLISKESAVAQIPFVNKARDELERIRKEDEMVSGISEVFGLGGNDEDIG